MKIIYRISDTGYNKVKPDYIHNENCLKNFCNIFFEHIWDIHVIADNVSEATYNMIKKYIDPINITKASVGHGAGTFNLALDMALKGKDDEIVYFVENDYIHLNGAPEMLLEGINLGAPYITLYLHPDKFYPPQYGGNPEVDTDGGYHTKIYRGTTELWGIFNSTTMTFATTVKTLKADENILRKHTVGTHPNDFHMFLELRDKGQILVGPLNTYSTHGETAYLAPLFKTKQEDLLTEWQKHIING
jgi:hypothetical protein